MVEKNEQAFGSDTEQNKEAHKLQEERRNRKPFFYCRLIATHPYIVFCKYLLFELGNNYFMIKRLSM